MARRGARDRRARAWRVRVPRRAASDCPAGGDASIDRRELGARARRAIGADRSTAGDRSATGSRARSPGGTAVAPARRERLARPRARDGPIVAPGSVRVARDGWHPPALRRNRRQPRQRREPAAPSSGPRARGQVPCPSPERAPVRRSEKLRALRPRRRRAGVAGRAAHGRRLPPAPAALRRGLPRARESRPSVR